MYLSTCAWVEVTVSLACGRPNVRGFCPPMEHPLLILGWPSPPLLFYLKPPCYCFSLPLFNLFSQHLTHIFFSPLFSTSSLFSYPLMRNVSDKLYPPLFHLQPSPNKRSNRQTLLGWYGARSNLLAHNCLFRRSQTDLISLTHRNTHRLMHISTIHTVTGISLIRICWVTFHFCSI